jgi:hypothetical protein
MVSPEPAGRTMASNSLIAVDLPGSKAHIETSRKHTEQERAVANHEEVGGECERESKHGYVKAPRQSDQPIVVMKRWNSAHEDTVERRGWPGREPEAVTDEPCPEMAPHLPTAASGAG